MNCEKNLINPLIPEDLEFNQELHIKKNIYSVDHKILNKTKAYGEISYFLPIIFYKNIKSLLI
jgi:hypothetical protein